jgi:hypothetical protein
LIVDATNLIDTCDEFCPDKDSEVESIETFESSLFVIIVIVDIELDIVEGLEDVS